MRTFIAIELDPGIKRTLSDFLRRLKKLAPRNISWIRESGMHLTLKFLGEVDEGRVPIVQTLMNDVAAASPAFPLKLKGTGFFPPQAKVPRVLWIGTEEQPAILNLEEKLVSGLERLGFAREDRPFRPHLTLGRVRHASGLGEAIAELEKNRETAFGEMVVTRITLFKSVLKSTGAEYSVLGEGPLS